MRHGVSFYVDVILIFFIALVFALMVAQMARRSRRPDALSWALIALFSALSIAYLISGLAVTHVISPMLPPWVGWMLRGAILVSGGTVAGLLAREERQNWER